MKKYLAFTLVAAFMIINATTTFAQFNTSKLDEKINRYVSFPYLSNDNLYGKVAIMFDVNNEGTLDINLSSTLPIFHRSLMGSKI